MNDARVEELPLRAAWVVGAGFLGTALHELLVEEGWASWRIDSDPAKADCVLDAADAAAVAACGLPRPDAVFLCMSTRGGDASAYGQLYGQAARAAVSRCPEARIVFCSSTSVYGVEDGSFVDETTACRPFREHGRVLLEAECVVQEAGGIVARLSALYGPGRCRAAQGYMAGEDCLAGDWDRWINFIHRDDAAAALLCLAGNAPAGTVWNVSDATPMRKGQLFSLMWESTGLPFPAARSRRALRMATNQRVDASALRLLGWVPAYPSFASALHEVLASLAGEGVQE